MQGKESLHEIQQLWKASTGVTISESVIARFSSRLLSCT
jgi:hypothetical protein